MFFMTRKRFYDAVAERLKEYEEQRFKEREMENIHNAIWKLQDRVDRLEGKRDGVAVEVKKNDI